jgi:drug/metabolite transporter (DMT)-like permease
MVIVWAANPAAIKWALEDMDPLVFNALRFALATLMPVALLLFSRESFRVPKGDGPKLLGLGLLGHGAYQILFILGLNLTLAGNAALILSINPAFVAVFGALLGYERIRGYTWAGVALTLAGAGLVILGSGEELRFGAQMLGDLLIVVVTVMWALYSVLSQSFLRRYSAVKLNALTMPVGAAALLAVASPAIVSTAPDWPSIPGTAWLVLVLSGLFAVSLSYIIWYKGVQKLGATRAAVYTNLVPVIAAVISYIFLQEPLGWEFWAGMVLVISGVSFARFGGRLFDR